MNPLVALLEKQVAAAVKSAGFELPNDAGLVRPSDRPDLSDYQSNVALALAKSLQKNPREIADKIAAFIEGASVVGGFINIRVAPEKVAAAADTIKDDPRLGHSPAKKKKKIVVDYGGPNVAKSLHVGHLRSSIIGESLKRLAAFAGHKVVGDIHLGDWGLPMGMVIAAIKEEGLKLPLSVETLNKLYPEASARSKTDGAFMARVQEETKRLQDGDAENRRIWRSFVKTSIDDIKKLLDSLDVHFEEWKGESDANDSVNALVKTLPLETSDGARVIPLDKYPMNGKPVPPFIAVKSNGAVMYGMTDLATIYDRVRAHDPDEIWYVADSRQALHFHQVFAASEIAGIFPRSRLFHFSLGNVLGADGKPMKTRAGDNVPLEELLDSAVEAAGSREIALAAIKFADLMNPRENEYVFNMQKFLAREGKTGVYVLYTAVRIKSILATGAGAESGKIILRNEHDRKLAIELLGFADSVERALALHAPNILVGHIYDLCVAFNSFYHSCRISSEEDEALRRSWTGLSKMTLRALESFASIIGITLPDRM